MATEFARPVPRAVIDEFRHDEHRPAHAKELEQRPPLVESVVEGLEREVADPGECLEVDRRRVRCVDADERLGPLPRASRRGRPARGDGRTARRAGRSRVSIVCTTPV
jgi:hypothetical protein